MKSENYVDEKIENETEVSPSKSNDVSGNDQIIVNVTPDPVDLSSIESEIGNLHYQQAEIASTLSSLADRPSVTPTMLYSLFFLSVVLIAYFSRK